MYRQTYGVSACALVVLGRGSFGLETSTKAFGHQGLSSHLEETKKSTVFGILSHLKKLSKSNDVHAQNKTFF